MERPSYTTSKSHGRSRPGPRNDVYPRRGGQLEPSWYRPLRSASLVPHPARSESAAAMRRGLGPGHGLQPRVQDDRSHLERLPRGRRPSFEPRACIPKFTRKARGEDRTVPIPVRSVRSARAGVMSPQAPIRMSDPVRTDAGHGPVSFPRPSQDHCPWASDQPLPLLAPAPSARNRLLRQSETALCILPRPSRPTDGLPRSVPASRVRGFSKIVRDFLPLHSQAARLGENGKILAWMEIRADAMPSGLTSRATGGSQAFQPSWRLVEIEGRGFVRTSERLV